MFVDILLSGDRTEKSIKLETIANGLIKYHGKRPEIALEMALAHLGLDETDIEDKREVEDATLDITVWFNYERSSHERPTQTQV
jgi:hypothetical protein